MPKTVQIANPSFLCYQFAQYSPEKTKKKWRRSVQWHSQQFIADIKIIMIEYSLIGIF